MEGKNVGRSLAERITTEELQAELDRRKRASAAKPVQSWPREFNLYVHASKESEAKERFIEAAGWEEGDERSSLFRFVGYEHKLTFMVEEDGTARLVAVDGKRLLDATVPRELQSRLEKVATTKVVDARTVAQDVIAFLKEQGLWLQA